MSYEYVVDLLEYDFSACQVVRTWQEVWSSLASLEYATWDQSSCEVTCETLAPQSGYCSSYGVDGYALEYTTYNFGTCATEETQCTPVPPCDTVLSTCPCKITPRYWTVTLPSEDTFYWHAPPFDPFVDATGPPPGTYVLEYDSINSWVSIETWGSLYPVLAGTPVADVPLIVLYCASAGAPDHTWTMDITYIYLNFPDPWTWTYAGHWDGPTTFTDPTPPESATCVSPLTLTRTSGSYHPTTLTVEAL